jgi:hypothetical protein
LSSLVTWRVASAGGCAVFIPLPLPQSFVVCWSLSPLRSACWSRSSWMPGFTALLCRPVGPGIPFACATCPFSLFAICGLCSAFLSAILSTPSCVTRSPLLRCVFSYTFRMSILCCDVLWCSVVYCGLVGCGVVCGIGRDRMG